MTINRKELFTLAWVYARQEQWSRRLDTVRGLFGDALRDAWRELKRRAVIAAERARSVSRTPADLLAAVREIENRDRLRASDLARLSDLRREYAAASEPSTAQKPKPETGHWTPSAPIQATPTRPARGLGIAATPQNSTPNVRPMA